MANIDRLTQIYNRAYFDMQLTLEMERAKRYDQDLFLIMIDIDHFKQFNDDYGHQKGDEVLTAVASIIKEHTRKNDTTARYGGEEMAVIIPCSTPENAQITGEKIRRMIETLSMEKTGVQVTISAGIASAKSSDLDVQKLIGNADRALYAAKKNGRNKVFLHQLKK